MSGTYTPTQTWHATATYVLTGETITETVAKDLGANAMDNIASLVGTAAGATPQAIRRIATVADLAALKAIAAADRADRDYVVLDDTKRVYQFDSASAVTGDDYATVTPNAGTGRWILAASSVPRTTSLRKALLAISMDIFEGTPGASPIKDRANGRVTCAGGGAVTLTGQIEGLKAGDVITEIQLVANANAGGGGTDVVATFTMVEVDDGSTTPTMTTLGTLTRAAGTSGEVAATAAPLPITIPDSPDCDVIHVEITCTSGAPTTSYIYWVAVNGTRANITE